MASPSIEAKKSEAKKKGAAAAVAAAASVAVLAAPGLPVALGVAGLAGSAVLGYRWVRFRIKEGLRF